MKLLIAAAALMAGVSAKPGTIRKIDKAQGAFVRPSVSIDFDLFNFSLVAKISHLAWDSYLMPYLFALGWREGGLEGAFQLRTFHKVFPSGQCEMAYRAECDWANSYLVLIFST